MGYIYKIVNMVNGKMYIGQTMVKYPNTRWANHKNSAKNGKDQPLYRAMRKYGIDNFKFVIMLKNIPVDKLDFYERLWIKKLNTQVPNGYNISPGGGVLRGKDNPMYGKTPWNKGKKCPEISKKMKEWRNKPEVQEFYSEKWKGDKNPSRLHPRKGKEHPYYGKHLSEEHKKHLSEALSGEKNPFYGKHHTEETKEKLSIAQNNKKKPIQMIDIKTKEVLMIFESLQMAEKWLRQNINPKADANACSKVARGKQQTAYGYLWKFVEKCID